MHKFYCPTCKGELEEHAACGSVSYFCDTCKVLVSRGKMLTEDQVKQVDLVVSPSEDKLSLEKD